MISLTAVEETIRTALEKLELECVVIDLPDEKKGEKVVLMFAEEIQLEDIKKPMLEEKANPLMIPSEVKVIDEIPKLVVVRLISNQRNSNYFNQYRNT